ncbi:hypothetical protein ABZ805_00170 [Saccharopolyspora sp. NPDC047091]|uniref:hypothetical protein n=1 Tax=Saccharopolyspora sp. NPDC047091 TaxID=3155924 RepID=UPI0033CBC366
MALGRMKTGRRQQDARGKSANQQQANEPDHELDSYLAALAPKEDLETTGSGRGFGGAEVYQLRLPLMANEKLKELAARQGTSPGALARDWVMQHLSQSEEPAPEPPRAAPQQEATPAWPQQEAGYEQQGYGQQPEYDPYAYAYGGETDTEITIPRGGRLR